MHSAERSVSVVICTYNRAEELQITLDSVKAPLSAYQGPVELLIVDNNSTDDTPQVATRFRDANPQLAIHLLTEPRQGLAIARNTGLHASRGDVVAFLDDDVSAPEAWLAELLSAFALDEKVGCVAGRIKLQWPDIFIPRWVGSREKKLLSAYECGDTSYLQSPGTVFIGANFALTRAAIMSVGEFNTELGRKKGLLLSGEDSEYAYRLWQAGFLIAYSATGYVNHRVLPDRLNFNWFWQRAFWGGVTNTVLPDRRYFGYPLRRIHKLISGLLGAIISVVLFNRTLLYRACFRIAETLGVFYGGLLQLHNVRKINGSSSSV